MILIASLCISFATPISTSFLAYWFMSYSDKKRRVRSSHSEFPPDETPLLDCRTAPWLYELGRAYRPSLRRAYMGVADEVALKKSWDLLVSFLDENQLKDLLTNGQFTVTASSGRPVKIRADWSHVNVAELDYNQYWCTVPNAPVPLWDHLLSQLLMITHDWEKFCKTAHSW